MREYEKTGPSLQTKAGPNWQWPQTPTAHFMLRSMDRKTSSGGTPRWTRSAAANRIMTSGPQTKAVVVAGSNVARGMQRGDHADVSVPRRVARVDRRAHVEVEPRAPVRQLAREQQARGRARPDQEHHAAERAAPRHDGAYERAERGQPEPARHDDHVTAERGLDGPAFSVRSTDAQDVVFLCGADRLRHRAHGADGVDEHVRLRRIAADRERHFANPEDVDHRELARSKPDGTFAVGGFELERPHVGQLTPDARHAERARQECRAIWCGQDHTRRGVGAWRPPADWRPDGRGAS